MKINIRLYTFLALLFFACSAQSSPVGVDSILTGEASFVEGAIHRIVYAPGTTQSLNFDGSWHAIISDQGLQIETTLDGIQRDLTIIGNDEFLLETRSGGFQAGEIKPITNNIAEGKNLILDQYILKRISEINHRADDTNVTYAKFWFIFQSALQADTEEGVKCSRSFQGNAVDDKWYMDRHFIAGKSMPVATYPAGGCLVIDCKSKMGDLTPGESFSIKEYWPKTVPVSGEDVYPFRDTELTVSAVKAITASNLLAKISYASARLEDYRFIYSTNGMPLNLPLKSVLWMLRSSPHWGEYSKMAAAKISFTPEYAEIKSKGNLKVRFALIAGMVVFTIGFAAWAFSFGRGKQIKTE
ncbi:MAG TPA: hypothetical protein VG347_23125 [Verrucomicrobiae bacterium]|nr:hypothetical protein [Verrucomicrobiae bacterium]